MTARDDFARKDAAAAQHAQAMKTRGQYQKWEGVMAAAHDDARLRRRLPPTAAEAMQSVLCALRNIEAELDGEIDQIERDYAAAGGQPLHLQCHVHPWCDEAGGGDCHCFGPREGAA